VSDVVHFHSFDLIGVSEVDVANCLWDLLESFVPKVDEVPVAFKLLAIIDVSVDVR
jgi:hypothetical protein